MATAGQVDFPATSQWQDVTGTIGDVASADVALQFKGRGVGQVFFGGGSAPASDDYGKILEHGDSITGNSANVWVRAAQGGSFAVTLL
jgi:hypothetical protein